MRLAPGDLLGRRARVVEVGGQQASSARCADSVWGRGTFRKAAGRVLGQSKRLVAWQQPALPGWRLLVAEVVVLAKRHLSKLDAAQRRRPFSLLVRAEGRPRSLTAAERYEFLYLVAMLEPRLLLGTAIRRVSPLPLPRRLLFGRPGTTAQVALSRRD
jgi:hypothetical protein